MNPYTQVAAAQLTPVTPAEVPLAITAPRSLTSVVHILQVKVLPVISPASFISSHAILHIC